MDIIKDTEALYTEVRTRMRNLFKNALIERHIPFVTITGNWDKRKAKAVESVATAQLELIYSLKAAKCV